MKRNIKVIAATALLCLVTATTLQADYDNEYHPLTSETREIQLFSTPLRSFFSSAQITRTGDQSPKKEEQNELYVQAMQLYIERMYNDPHYAKHLSQDATHMVEFFSLAADFELNNEAVYTGMRLFYNKLKEIDVIDDTAALHLLDELPSGLATYFPMIRTAPFQNERPSKIIENLILSQLTDHLSRSTQDSDEFFEGIRHLSDRIENFIQQQSPHQEAEMKEMLRNQTTQFCELILNKVMWYPSAYEDIWENFLNLAHCVQLLGVNHIINHMDHIDNLLWTLVLRFKFFIEKCGSALPEELFTTMRHDIESGSVLFLEANELDAGITSKKEMLLRALAMAETKSIAFRTHGIISDTIFDV